MRNGFLGYEASFMLDVVVCALALIVPVLLWSLFLVRYRRNFLWHRNVQLGLGVVLLVAVAAFEIDMQLIHGGWENVVNKPHHQPRVTGKDLEAVRQVLRVHLVFAISTPLLWATTIALAWKNFPNPPQPGPHSRLHMLLGWTSALDVTLTSITGLIFYHSAFVR